ncbi:sugar kinase [Arenibacter sp. GZD96]|uniref:sugar kinase n=1 Tax=Aurantibrevibacter litoralis TaxID=3106030 RepID=UPI002AFF8D99|nr:sugar kinase [Arenibacter sp. GZD-96]MEA1786252.1 sugar kinase [Arenibacter sp. GZD-96]
MSFLTFGEIMLRLTPQEKSIKLGDTDQFLAGYAGSESNVASSLAILGNTVDFITKLPNNALGNAAIKSLLQYGIGIEGIARGGQRIGTYFIELGHSIRPSSVLYDRAHSAISNIKMGEFHWDTLLKDTSWVFVSGITPALSNSCAEETILLVETAKKLGVNVSFDFNFRRSLWTSTVKARKIFDQILASTDLLFANTGALSDVYGYTYKVANTTDQTMEAIDKIKADYGVKNMAFTIRDHTSATHNTLSAVYQTENNREIASSYSVTVLDRFGTGDAFAAAFLHGLEKKWPPKKIIDFATAAFALKHTVKGDQHTSSETEILSIMDGHTSGHVIR